VAGFDLYSIEAAQAHRFPDLPSGVPLIYAKGRRVMAFAPRAAAVSLYQLINRRLGQAKFRSRDQLSSYFGLDRSTTIIASGTAKDPPLERWWSLGASKRRTILNELSALGIAAITAPNFSVFNDVPRWDNFHDMKRIRLCWGEILDAGIPAALHVNARAPRDWERWAEFVKARSEVDAIAYEFATGAVGRFSHHVGELCKLADRVSRPLKLVVRGGLSALPRLRQSYASVSMIDSTTYMRSANRKSGIIRESGSLVWVDAQGRPDVDMDSLIEHNYLTMLHATEAP
jgi:hypothetical protein